MLLSVICPTLNEEDHIEKILQHFLQSPPFDKELFIIDGGSKDRTLEIIKVWTLIHPNIHLLQNPDRYVSYALNKAIPLCKGHFIARIDAHTEYATDYYQTIINTFEAISADIVGGPTRTKATNLMQEAIAFAICKPLAIGNSQVHFENYKGYTDSVTFGAWRREIFKITGLFDTNMIRNQDDEFHYRAKSKGLKIYQNPEIRLYYYPRSTLSGLFSQYFYYGFYKPLVLRKVPSGFKWRHLIPSFFVLYLLSFPLVFLWPYWLLPLILYLLLITIVSLKSTVPLSVKLRIIFVFPTIHTAYGIGFLTGLPSLWKK